MYFIAVSLKNEMIGFQFIYDNLTNGLSHINE